MNVSRVETRRRWQERLARFAASDFKVAEFCEQELVSPASFYLWRRRLRGSASGENLSSQPSPPPQFLPVVLSGAPMSVAVQGGPGLELELPNHVCLRLPRDVEAEFVGRLLVTVAALGPDGLQATSPTTAVR
jgi:hypothetical protein